MFTRRAVPLGLPDTLAGARSPQRCQYLTKPLLDARGREILKTPALALEHAPAHVTIVYDARQELRGHLEIFRREQDPRPAERFGHRAGGIRDDRHVGRHGLDE